MCQRQTAQIDMMRRWIVVGTLQRLKKILINKFVDLSMCPSSRQVNGLVWPAVHDHRGQCVDSRPWNDVYGERRCSLYNLVVRF